MPYTFAFWVEEVTESRTLSVRNVFEQITSFVFAAMMSPGVHPAS